MFAPDPVSASSLVVPLTAGLVPGSHGEDYPLVAVVGPTAAGKSALGVELARAWGGEVVNYDSVQVYQGFEIGSGKLPVAERRGVPHHLLDFVSPHSVFTAGDFAREAARVLEDIRRRGRLPVLVGGTGLYLRALLQGLFEGPTRSEAVRARLRRTTERRGPAFLHRMLARLDAASARRIMPRDTQKMIRALEVRIVSGQPISALHARGRNRLEGFRAVKIGLNPPRPELYQRINARVERMFDQGLVEEARVAYAAWTEGGTRKASPLCALGYPQALAVAKGEMARDEAIRQTQTATRQYAKRQLTWFRRETDVTWFEGFGDDPDLQSRIAGWLRNVLEAGKAGHFHPLARLD